MQARSTVSISDTVQIHRSNPIAVVGRTVSKVATNFRGKGAAKTRIEHTCPINGRPRDAQLRRLVDREQIVEERQQVAHATI